jgi:hypothetical protein
MVSEDVEFGYGKEMIDSTDKREDFNPNNLFEKKKFDNNSFNDIFTKHVLLDKTKQAPIVKYKEPEPMVLAKKMNYTEIGGKRPDDYSSSVEKEGKNSLVYTDYKKAYSTGRLVSQEELSKHKEFNSIEEYQSYRDNRFKKGLSEKERKYLEIKKIKEEKEEQERLERIRNEDLRIKINNEKASRLFIK